MTFKSFKPSQDSSDTGARAKPINSPCVSVCVLNDEDVCVGCYRTGSEISQWGRMADDNKLAVLEHCRERAKKLNPFL
ncbi:DUF1289 domain-containing protein [Sessilibacter sp. MAH2]